MWVHKRTFGIHSSCCLTRERKLEIAREAEVAIQGRKAAVEDRWSKCNDSGGPARSAAVATDGRAVAAATRGREPKEYKPSKDFQNSTRNGILNWAKSGFNYNSYQVSFILITVMNNYNYNYNNYKLKIKFKL